MWNYTVLRDKANCRRQAKNDLTKLELLIQDVTRLNFDAIKTAEAESEFCCWVNV